MVSEKMEVALNGQLNKEMYSAYLYMSMSAQADAFGLKGVASWFMVQYHEEMVHAMKIYEYIARQGNQIRLATLEQPPGEFQSALDMYNQSLDHEKFISRSINELVDLALTEKDYATKTFLDWYVTEQVEEEQSVQDILQTLKLIGENSGALYMFDKELGARPVTVPTDFSRGVTAAMGK